MTKIAHLENRSLLRIGGSAVVDFLQNLVTCDIEGLQIGQSNFGALLTPQGKILFDFFVLRTNEGVLLETDANQRDALMKRLMFYRLRADVIIEPVDEAVYASWDGESDKGLFDPRNENIGKRFYAVSHEVNASQADWQDHRIDCGVPQSGEDFESGAAFPHEVLMDQFADAGVDFSKGCFVGQEVVSRMQHRGTARNRIVKVLGETQLPAIGEEIVSDDRTIGTMGGSVGPKGLALVRLDRAAAAKKHGAVISVNGIPIQLNLPDFVDFGWPE